jgi:hypothetical protein
MKANKGNYLFLSLNNYLLYFWDNLMLILQIWNICKF